MANRRGAGALGLAAAAVGLLVAAVGALVAVITVTMARRVVTPSLTRPEDERIISVDLASAEVVLAASDETRMRARDSLAAGELSLRAWLADGFWLGLSQTGFFAHSAIMRRACR